MYLDNVYKNQNGYTHYTQIICINMNDIIYFNYNYYDNLYEYIILNGVRIGIEKTLFKLFIICVIHNSDKYY